MRSGVAFRLETSRDRLIISRNCLLSTRPLTPSRQSRYHGSRRWPGDAGNTPGRGATCLNR